MSTNPLRKYLRENSLPHFFCPGCGAAQVLNYFVQAADELDLDFDNLVAIGGVGCAARIPVYLHAESLHGINDELKIIHLPGAIAYEKPSPWGLERSGASG